MKRLLLLLVMLFCWISVAFAAVSITEQPETQTVEAGGKVSFTVKASGAAGSGITWHFMNDLTGEDITGRKLSDRFQGLKVSNPNRLKITLQNVPEEMHGWTVYCHIGKAGGGVDTEHVKLLIAGKDPDENALGQEPDAEPVTGAEEREAPENHVPEDDEEETEETDDTEVTEETEETDDTEETEVTEETEDTEEPEDSVGEEALIPEEPGTASAEIFAEAGSESGGTAGSETLFPAIRGFKEDAQQEYQFLQLGTYYYKENGGMEPLVWRILYREENKLTLMTEYIIDVHQLYETDTYYSRTNKKKYKSHFNDPYEELGIYFWLNGEMAETIFSKTDFSKAIIPHKIKESNKGEADDSDVPEWPDPGAVSADEAAKSEIFPYGKDLFYIMTYGDMKKAWYGFPNTTFGDAIEQAGEKAVPEAGRRKTWATPYAKNKLLYPQWKQKLKLTVMSEYKGTSPYWAIKRRKNYYMAGIVGGNGHLSWRAMDSVQIGVRPAMRIDLTQLKVSGGSGTLKDPWIMELAE